MHTHTNYIPDYLLNLAVDQAEENDIPLTAGYADVIERGLRTIDAMDPAEYEAFRDFHLGCGQAATAIAQAPVGGRGKINEQREAHALVILPLWGNGVTIPQLCQALNLTAREVVDAIFGKANSDVDLAIAIEADVLAGEVEATSMRKLARKYGGDRMRLVRKACEAHPVTCRGRQAA